MRFLQPNHQLCFGLLKCITDCGFLLTLKICRTTINTAPVAHLAVFLGIMLSCLYQLPADEHPPNGSSLRWAPASSITRTKVSSLSATNDKIPVERFRVINRESPEEIRVVASIPASMLHNDFEASLRIHSTVTGMRFGLLVLLPYQPDPRTGMPLETILPGEVLQEADQWQTLEVKATQKNVEAQLRRIRADLNRPDIRMQQAMIIGLVLVLEASPGETFFDIGSADFGRIITPSKDLLKLVSAQTVDQTESVKERNFIPIDIELGGLMLDQRPVVLRFAPDHAEHIETLKQLGLNAVWVPDYRSTDRAKELYDAQFGVLATPPHPEFEPGDYSRLLQSLPPLDQQCPNVSAWIQGTRVTPEEQVHLMAWSREVRSADRVFQRLQMADVTGSEGAVAREIDLVGIGRHVVGRDITFGSLRNLLIRRQQNAGQLTFPWTWIQTEPSSTQQAWRESQRLRPPFLEPEQIQQGVYTALSAGYKGVGFWKTHALQIDNPRDRETAIAIELACMEIELLEPFLARGRMEGYLGLQRGDNRNSNATKDVRSRLNSALGGRSVGATVADHEGPGGHDAAVITNGGNTLILATAWDGVSQFVPGPMFEQEISMVVAASETASAWQISTTGINGLPREVTAGGLSLKIRNFDQSAALIVSSNPATLIPELEQKIHAMAPRAAARMTELASLKYVRVLETIEQLREEHTVPPGVDAFMSQAKQMLDRSEFELNNKDYHESAIRARDAMLFARQAQQACWKDAISNLTSPTASPHTISFATLPDHWRLIHYLDQQNDRLSENQLLSGDFENLKSAAQDGWSLNSPPKSQYSSTADILQDPRSGKILRLIAWQSDVVDGRATRDDTMPLIVTTPAIPVSSGDVMVVSGRMRKGRSTSADSKRPLVIFDSEMGTENSIRTELDSEWESFELIRPIATSTSFSVSLGLIGEGDVEEVHIDDLSIQKLPAMTSSAAIRFTGRKIDAGEDIDEVEVPDTR